METLRWKMAEKTAEMLDVERRFEEKLETLIPKLINELGSTGKAAKRLGISRNAFFQWRIRLDITTETKTERRTTIVATPPR
jgi:transposase-like protein